MAVLRYPVFTKENHILTCSPVHREVKVPGRPQISVAQRWMGFCVLLIDTSAGQLKFTQENETLKCFLQ